MSYRATTTAIQTYFAAQWALSAYSDKAVLYENVAVADDPAQGNEPWIRLVHKETENTKVTFGGAHANPIFRYIGMIHVQCFVRAGTGTDVAEDMADVVLEAFKEFSINDADAGLIRNDRALRPYQNRVGEFNGWFQINVVIPCMRDARELTP